MNRKQLLDALKKILLARELTFQETEAHIEAGDKNHAPQIVSRCGGIPPDLLNTCGICGAQIVPSRVDRWIPVSDEVANEMRDLWTGK
jgi:hypothetical protein